MIDATKQISIFGKEPAKDKTTSLKLQEWEKEWQGMPEFVQEKQRPYSAIIVRFETKEDLEDFSKIIGQNLTEKTKSIWHPFKSHWGIDRKEWVDES